MTKAHPTAILNSALPPSFRQIRLELAREAGHPEGDHGIAYVIVAPLDANNRIDPTVSVRTFSMRGPYRAGRKRKWRTAR